MHKFLKVSISTFSIALGATILPTPASACTDTANQWDCLHDGTGTYPTTLTSVGYAGSGTLSHWYSGTIACDDVRATMDFAIASGTLYLDFTDFSASNSTNPSCANLTFKNFNWSGSHDGNGSPDSETDTTPVSAIVGAIVVEINGVNICFDSSTDILFEPDGNGGSRLDFDTSISGWAGSCSLDMTVANASVVAH